MAVRNGNGRSNFLFGTFGSDEINGRGGNDFLFGLWGNDTIRGGNGNDWMFGGSGSDRLFGGNGNDVGFGGSGNDRLVGGRGSDVMFGGSGNDTFVYRADRNVGETDFYSGGSGNDRLVLRLNADEAADADIQADIAAFETFIAAGGGGNFTFDSLGLTVNGIERLTVRAPDPVEPTNNAPIVGAQVDLGAIDENTMLTVSAADLLAGASDADNDPLTVGDIVVTSENASVVADGANFIITPDTDDESAVTLSYTISDGAGGSVTQTATLDLLPTNNAPVVSGPVILGAITEDIAQNFAISDLLDGASDADSDPISAGLIAVTSGNASVSYLLSGPGDVPTFRVTPDADANGEITLSYTIMDDQGGSVEQTATIAITEVNDAPVAQDGELTVGEDGSVNFTPFNLVSDVDGDTLSYSYDFSEASGSVVSVGNSEVIYSPDAALNALGDGEIATDSFTYSVSDGQATSTGTVTVTVIGENDAPVAVDDDFLGEPFFPPFDDIEGPIIIDEVEPDGPREPAVIVDQNGFVFPVLANDFDPDGDVLEITGVTGDNGLTAEIIAGPNGDEIFVRSLTAGNGDELGMGFIRPVDLVYTISDGEFEASATLSFLLEEAFPIFEAT